jgi:integrase/recombinase XerC
VGKKSLRALAKELGVTASYLSQVKSGKRNPSAKIMNASPEVLSKLNGLLNSGVCYNTLSAPVAQRIEHRSSELHQRNELISRFINSRPDGTSPRTLDYYKCYLDRAIAVIGFNIPSEVIVQFLKTRTCSSGGKFSYFRVLRTFYRWLYGLKSGYKLNALDNPILRVEPPRPERKILPSLTIEQVDYLINLVDSVRDKAIISLFTDSGLRLNELAYINPANINWERRLIKVKIKGNKEGYAPFGKRTETFLKEWLNIYKADNSLWDLNRWGISIMLRRLKAKTGLPCNPHTFRRTFASILAKRGVDSLHIMRLGRWESIEMVEHYTRSIKFEDSLKLYSDIVH